MQRASPMSTASVKCLNSKPKVFLALVLTVAAVIYFTTTSSGVWFYEYTPADRIADTILTASASTVHTRNLALCPLIPYLIADATSSISIDLHPDEATIKELSLDIGALSPVLKGGAWRPKGCVSRHRVAIIVPYRNRLGQLHIFLNHMHRFLRQQLLDYRIVVVEQNDTHPFNRASLLNVGYVESLKLYDFHCFVFHDVDLLPEVLANMYACSTNPRHMSVAVNTMSYSLPYRGIFGGVTAMTSDQFKSVNGYSNSFFGWGGEDDDMSDRMEKKGIKPMRWDPKISRYYMMSHAKEVPNPNRFDLLRQGLLRQDIDGLSDMSYKRLLLEELELYTLVSVELDYKPT